MNKKIHTEVNIGIDTIQTQLDIYVRPCGDSFSVENTAKGAREVACRLRSYQPTRVLIEATGRLEMLFVCAACNTDAEHGSRPRVPDGMKTTSTLLSESFFNSTVFV